MDKSVGRANSRILEFVSAMIVKVVFCLKYQDVVAMLMFPDFRKVFSEIRKFVVERRKLAGNSLSIALIGAKIG